MEADLEDGIQVTRVAEIPQPRGGPGLPPEVAQVRPRGPSVPRCAPRVLPLGFPNKTTWPRGGGTLSRAKGPLARPQHLLDVLLRSHHLQPLQTGGRGAGAAVGLPGALPEAVDVRDLRLSDVLCPGGLCLYQNPRGV